MEILLFVMLICNYETKDCSMPGGIMSPYYSDQRSCERDSAAMTRNFRNVPKNSFERHTYVSCFKKTASGLAETIADNGDFERDFRDGKISIAPMK